MSTHSPGPNAQAHRAAYPGSWRIIPDGETVAPRGSEAGHSGPGEGGDTYWLNAQA